VIKEFRDFIMRGNVLDLAIAVVIGAAFTAIVTSLVDNVITPIIGAIVGNPDFSAIVLGPIRIGSFINSVISFVLIALVLFFVFVKPMNMAMKRLKTDEAPSTRTCPECLAEIPTGARRCQYCTVVLEEAGAALPAD